VDETADGDGLNRLRVREADLQKHLATTRSRKPTPSSAIRRKKSKRHRRAGEENQAGGIRLQG
jgi:carboxyl-terminal processing protease